MKRSGESHFHQALRFLISQAEVAFETAFQMTPWLRSRPEFSEAIHLVSAVTAGHLPTRRGYFRLRCLGSEAGGISAIAKLATGEFVAAAATWVPIAAVHPRERAEPSPAHGQPGLSRLQSRVQRGGRGHFSEEQAGGQGAPRSRRGCPGPLRKPVDTVGSWALQPPLVLCPPLSSLVPLRLVKDTR